MEMDWPSKRTIKVYAKNPNLENGIAVSLINDKDENKKEKKEKDR